MLQIPAMEAAVEMYYAYIRRFTPRTQGHYRFVLGRFRYYAPDSIQNLNVEHIERYIGDVIAKFSNRTGNAHLTVIKSFCRFISQTYDLSNPAEKIKMLPESPPKQRILTEVEYQTILAVAEDKVKDIILFLTNTGLRAAEALNIPKAAISQDMTYLSIIGKGRKFRIVPLNQIARDIIQRHTNSHSPVIEFSKSISRNYYNGVCRRLSIKCGLKLFGPHSLRHRFCTELLRRGVPIAKVSKCLGHSSIRTTEQIYMHFTNSDIVGITDILQ